MDILNTMLSEEAKKSIIVAVQEGVKIRVAIERSKDELKDISDHLKEAFDVKPAEFNKIVDTIYKQNIDEQRQKVLDLEGAVNTILGVEGYGSED